MTPSKTSTDTPNNKGAAHDSETKPETKASEPEKPQAEPAATPQDEDAINQAVQVLSNFATLKLKVQELRDQALQVRSQVDVLFSDEVVTEEALNQLKDGFKVLKNFAQINLRYREARGQAEQARSVLDQALQPPQSSSKGTKSGS